MTPTPIPDQAEPRPLTTPVQFLPGVGPRRAQALADLTLTNLGRLIAYLPFRYEHERAESTIAELDPGTMTSTRGEITATRIAGRGRKQRFEAVLMDETGRLDLVWFGQPFLTTTILPGMRLWVQGKPARRGPMLQMAHPIYEILPDDDEPEQHRERLRPIYHATERISSKQIERIIAEVLEEAVAQIEDHFPPQYRRDRELPLLSSAYRMIHAPQSKQEIAEARRRLAYDELFMLQLAVHLKRRHVREVLHAPPLPTTPEIDERIRARIPFKLTPAQDRVIAEITRDIANSTPTNRLIQGDVGSGKTVVAAVAMLHAVAHSHQAAMMAPTEILAEQHYQSITNLLKGSRVRTALLTGSLSESERTDLHAAIAEGDIDLVIGTHALITEAVAFHSLALVVIDEQHRFGVHQRAALRAKTTDENSSPHVLVMTATPIPRTVAMTLFGDLDQSTIDELPPGRQPIETQLLRPAERADADAILADRIAQGEQAFVVVPSIEGQQMAGIEQVHQRLKGGLLNNARIATLHARMPRDKREQTMTAFRRGETDVLIATTIIEVGVDIPGATVMLIEDADRFGLAQLHQLRGRIGRGSKPSICILIADPKTPDAQLRLEAMAETTSGFVLAEKDFQIRGPGELIGARQAGDMFLQVADLSRDLDLLKMSCKDAAAWVETSPRLTRPEDTILRRRLLQKYDRALGLVDIA
jgi:ATP-dependent DNA helicase RecG